MRGQIKIKKIESCRKIYDSLEKITTELKENGKIKKVISKS